MSIDMEENQETIFFFYQEEQVFQIIKSRNVPRKHSEEHKLGSLKGYRSFLMNGY